MGSTRLPPLMNYFSNIEDTRREIKNGKTVRRMATKICFKAGTDVKPIHLVSVWTTENQLVFAQE